MSHALARAARVLGSDGKPAGDASIRPPFTTPHDGLATALSVPRLPTHYDSWQQHLVEAHAPHAGSVSLAEAYRRKLEA